MYEWDTFMQITINHETKVLYSPNYEKLFNFINVWVNAQLITAVPQRSDIIALHFHTKSNACAHKYKSCGEKCFTVAVYFFFIVIDVCKATAIVCMSTRGLL